MKQEYVSMRLSVENKDNIIRRKSDGQSFGKGLVIMLRNDKPENYEEVAYKPEPEPEPEPEENNENNAE